MEVILKDDIENLGFKDEVVKVKPGYARNYLIPRGLAVKADAHARKMLEEILKQRTKKTEGEVAEAKKTAESLANVDVKITVKVGEKNKMFGSVTNADLSDKLKESGYSVDKKYIAIKGTTIKELGKFEADIRLHKDVSTVLEFEVVAAK